MALAYLLVGFTHPAVALEGEALPDMEDADDPLAAADLFEDTGGSSGSGSILHWPSIKWTTDWFGYFEGSPSGGEQHLFRSELQFNFEGSLGDHLSYTVTPQLRADSGDNHANRFEFREDGARRPLATFREANLGWSSGSYELSVGKKIFNWGVADAWNPVDDLSAWDYLDIPTAERTGVPAISGYRFGDKIELQGVLVPLFTPSRIPLPGSDNRWLPNLGSLLPPGSDFEFSGRDLPADQFENAQVGARVSSSTLIDGWDLAAVYFRGHQSAGVFRGDLSPDGTINSSLEYPRYQEFGASFSTVLGSWQIHGEGSYHDTDLQEMDDDYIEYIVGVNRNFPELPIPLVDETILILEYAGQEITERTSPGSPYFGSREFTRPFGDAVIGNVTFKFSEDTELKLAGSYDFADSGSSYEAALAHKFSDNLKVELGTNIFSGPSDSFFGKWDDNDRFFMSMIVNW